MAIKVLNQLDLNSSKIVNVADPTAAQDAATKAYVDANFGKAIDVQIFIESGTWYKPSGAKFVDVFVVGGGGGGQSGALIASTLFGELDATGGIAGVGGAIERRFMAVAGDVTNTVVVTIGAGGNGGAARTTEVAGANGSNGGTSSFGAYISAAGGLGGGVAGGWTAATFQGGGGSIVDGNLSGTAVNGGGQAGTDLSVVGSFASNAYTSTLAANKSYMGNVDNTPTYGAGIISYNELEPATAGNGNTPTTRTGKFMRNHSGAGGGAAIVRNIGNLAVPVGGNGGAGGIPGGGGGGGGAAAAQRSTPAGGTRSGAGGTGGRGEVIVVTYF